MEYRELGRTGLRVSVVGRTAPLGDMFGVNDEDAALQAAYRALDAGINFFDSSPSYGTRLAERRWAKCCTDAATRSSSAPKPVTTVRGVRLLRAANPARL